MLSRCIVTAALLFPLTALAFLSDVPEDQRDITVKRIKASQFLHHATFGPTFADITSLAGRMAEIGDNAAMYEWINQQYAMPFSARQSYERLARNMIADDGFAIDSRAADTEGLDYGIQNYKHHAWWHRVLRGDDQLRQRTAWALIQILVISENGMGLNNRAQGHWLGILNYHDMLMRHAFGNYRDILQDVTLHPAMGRYLSHVKNRKGDPAQGIFPDENYAREVLQLLSIGVYALQQNGNFRRSAGGQLIETYDNDTIRNFARVFTGLSYAPSNGRDNFSRNPRYMFAPMKMYDDFHDKGEKTLLNNIVLPAGQSGMDDITAALDNIFQHENVPPFIARLLIQRFTTSNPSPAYVKAVADKFADDGRGNRGNMRAVMRRILMHPEARNSLQITQTRKSNGRYRFTVTGKVQSRGKLREPALALSAMYRAFRAEAAHPDGRFRPFSGGNVTNQGAFQAPSVFNFYLPGYQPAELLENGTLVAPEFQIYTPVMVNTLSNFIRTRVRQRSFGLGEAGTINLSGEENIAANATRLLDRLNLLLSYGTLNNTVMRQLRDTIVSTPKPELRAELAVMGLLISPDFAIME